MHPGFEAHDLAHFAVETELGFKKAFYGLLADGYTIQDFELPRDQRPEALMPVNLPPESLQTEHMVNLLMTEYQHPEGFNFETTLKEILEEHELGQPIGLTAASLERIRGSFHELLSRWNALAEGEELHLTFEV